ncbi:MAG TPA: hypothetical protein VGY98_14005 [Verrucomicrobiae bacterium]|nr:hypothetical protein [Verrucomicrobiae bacterium]
MTGFCRAFFVFFFALLWLDAVIPAAAAPEPRIVNIYNFVRDNDYRLSDSRAVLFQTTTQQVQLLKKAGLPATFALQYDALMDANYQNLFKGQTNFELGCWWEIPQDLAERAGLKWRGQHEWDSTANVGFSPGYTLAERRKLVDVYMRDFRKIFGYYPKTAGSWYIDEVTLEYMAEKYGIIASCNCKDQIGTDGYTLWGGYWNQAYYPSRRNAYMPAQTKENEIRVPIFRMLGSDPIYQSGNSAGMHTLEPVYQDGGGGSPAWVAWFLENLIHLPALAFGYTQAGQENSFGWDAMKSGFIQQLAFLSTLDKAGEIKIETLADSGQWFRARYALTPPSAVVALNDWEHENRKTVWYDSRFYRLNLLWQDGKFFIRDLHCFDENVISPTHDTALATKSLAYDTLPIMDCAVWSDPDHGAKGMWPVSLSRDKTGSPLTPIGEPLVTELSATGLEIRQPLAGGGTFSLVCRENKLICDGADATGQPLRWAWNLMAGPEQSAVLRGVTSSTITYCYKNSSYRLHLAKGNCRRAGDECLQLTPDHSGKMVLDLDVAN